MSDHGNQARPEELLSEELVQLLAPLDERERDILIFRFGLIDGEQRTLEEAGEKFNMIRERVRQIEALAMFKLRGAGNNGAFDFFFE